MKWITDKQFDALLETIRQRKDANEFIGRFMLHVWPKGFKHIRHYGLRGPVHKTANLAAARTALEALLLILYWSNRWRGLCGGWQVLRG